MPLYVRDCMCIYVYMYIFDLSCRGLHVMSAMHVRVCMCIYVCMYILELSWAAGYECYACACMCVNVCVYTYVVCTYLSCRGLHVMNATHAVVCARMYVCTCKHMLREIRKRCGVYINTTFMMYMRMHTCNFFVPPPSLAHVSDRTNVYACQISATRSPVLVYIFVGLFIHFLVCCI
jgi:hypothetical protein